MQRDYIINALREFKEGKMGMPEILMCVDAYSSASNGTKPHVSGALPMYDVDELNEIVKLYNNDEIDLYTCIGRVWNKAYFIGANEGMKAGQLGNDR